MASAGATGGATALSGALQGAKAAGGGFRGLHQLYDP